MGAAKDWLVYAKRPFVGLAQVLKYLARYRANLKTQARRAAAGGERDVSQSRCGRMKTYENSYFRLCLDFPDTWKLTSWRHTKIARSWRSAYQATDDDLPRTGKSASKFLFTAALHPPESPAIVVADIELSVRRLSPGEDMRASLVENLERQRAHYETQGIVTPMIQEGTWTIGGMDFTYVDQESTTRSGMSRYRFILRPHHEVFWFYGKIAGHTREAYDEAVGIVQGLKRTAESIG